MLAEHQREAVARLRTILRERGGAILADDIGLGKSFVAAEVMHRAKGAVDLVVPAALIPQWSSTLREFGIQAEVLTHDGIVRSPFVAVPRERLLVVDEAHAFRNPRTLRYAALARRSAGAAVLLVTATPVCNSIGDLEALVRLVARDDLLADAGVPSIDAAFAARDRELIATVVAELVVRRDRSVLPQELQFGTLDRRVVHFDTPPLAAIDALAFPLVGEAPLLRRLLWRRLESSEAAFAESVRRQLRFYGRALSSLAAGRVLTKREYRRAFGQDEDRDAFQEVLFWDLFAPPAGDVDPAAIRAEMLLLDGLLAAALAAPSSKRRLLLDLMALEREPVLIFTCAAATAADLREAMRMLRPCGLVTARQRSREGVIEAFRRGLVDVVVSTDLAAEGLNLQRAGMVVHYDLPWNPVKLDQRNGRAWRIGQERQSIRAVYFVPRVRDTGIVATVARKNRVRRRLLASAAAPRSDALSTLRPRVVRSAACLRLAAAAARRGLALSDLLRRRHRAGIEILMHEMAAEYLDRKRIEELEMLAEAEMKLSSPGWKDSRGARW